MIRVVVFALVLLASLVPQGSASASAAASAPLLVKLISHTKEGSTKLVGSGLGFSLDGHRYVVTSDHVVLHTNRGVLHDVFVPRHETGTAQLVTCDFGRGLALLEVTAGLLDLEWPELDSVTPVLPPIGARVQMRGFPYASNEPLSDQQGHIKNQSVSHSPFVQMDQVIEVAGGHAEFGMSGGVALDEQKNWVGLLSHQIVEGLLEQNNILVIRASEIRGWIHEALSLQTPVTLFQTVEQQLYRDATAVSTNGVSFVFLKPAGDRKWQLVLFLSKTNFPKSGLFDGPTRATASAVQTLESHPDCNLNVTGFQSRDSALPSSGIAPNAVAVLRAWQSPELKPVTVLNCPMK